jgi:hypothetical protein
MEVIMIHFENGLQILAEGSNNAGSFKNPFQLISRPGPDGKLAMTLMAFAPFGVVDGDITFPADKLITSYLVDDKNIIASYKKSVADLKQKRSGIVAPTAPSASDIMAGV